MPEETGNEEHAGKRCLLSCRPTSDMQHHIKAHCIHTEQPNWLHAVVKTFTPDPTGLERRPSRVVGDTAVPMLVVPSPYLQKKRKKHSHHTRSLSNKDKVLAKKLVRAAFQHAPRNSSPQYVKELRHMLPVTPYAAICHPLIFLGLVVCYT